MWTFLAACAGAPTSLQSSAAAAEGMPTALETTEMGEDGGVEQIGALEGYRRGDGMREESAGVH